MASKTILLFSLLVLILTACGGGPAAEVRVDPLFTAEEASRVETGVAFLLASAGAQAPSVQIARVHRPPGHLGDCRPDGVIEVDPDQAEGEVLSVVIAHEMGHRLGLPHLPQDQVGLMHPYVSSRLVWTDNDQASCVAAGVCRSAGERP